MMMWVPRRSDRAGLSYGFQGLNRFPLIWDSEPETSTPYPLAPPHNSEAGRRSSRLRRHGRLTR